MIFFKKRYYVKQVWRYAKDSTNSYGNRADGVSLKDLETYIHKSAWRKSFYRQNKLTRYLPISYNHYQNAAEYLSFAVDDGYLVKNNFDYKLTSSGRDYISWKYPFKVILNNWIVRDIISFIVGAIMGWLLNEYR